MRSARRSKRRAPATPTTSDHQRPTTSDHQRPTTGRPASEEPSDEVEAAAPDATT